MLKLNLNKMEEKPYRETGDNGFDLEDTPDSIAFMKYNSIRVLESSGASYSKVLRIVGITEDEYDMLKNKFEISGED
jgi:hypothetical protein